MVENEKISGLVDGEMDDAQEAKIYSGVKNSADAREVWRTYHVIGDVMRGEGRSGIAQKRFSQALAAEPTVIAPRLRIIK
ncbi:MAG: sigma-E factor negative regulatory protein, partial [Betaproteobacteria bacterium]|nr:sigma-E factor negative regulatory protein [Betaproteobacteria bacterium]